MVSNLLSEESCIWSIWVKLLIEASIIFQGNTEPFFMSPTHPSWLRENNQGGFWCKYHLRWDIHNHFPRSRSVGIFSSGPPQVPHGTTFTFTPFLWFSHFHWGQHSFFHSQNWLGHHLLASSLCWTKKEDRFWAKTGSNVQLLGELRILALVTGLNLTIFFKLQSLSRWKQKS